MPSSKAPYRLISTSDPVGIVPPQPSADAEGAVALAFAVALLRALRDRGTLSRAEVDEVLDDVEEHVGAKATHLVDTVRRDLARMDDD
jgi:hypothetical protein